MVTSQKMSENEKGHRGSKSYFQIPQPNEIYVKEQRVDGSYFGSVSIPRLRCTLTGGKSRYHIKIPSKQLNPACLAMVKRTFYTLPLLSLNDKQMSGQGRNVLNPWFFSGFTDAEGCFSIGIRPDAKLKIKWRVLPVFLIKLHKKDLTILEDIQNTLHIGKIRKSGENCVQYVVESFKELQEIVNHFDNYPLVTAKVSDFLLFKQCFEMIKNREHLTEEGLLKIVTLKSSLNWGISDKLIKAFPLVIPVNRLEYKFKGIPDPFWIAGFTSGDGSFQVRLRKLNTNIGYRVSLLYSFHLHIRDLDVLKGLATYFSSNSKNLISNEKKVGISEDKSVHLQIAKFSDINEKIIPFFDKYPIEGVKSLDFEDFKKVCKLIETKEHLTPLGIKAILDIKLNMNQNRKIPFEQNF
jgi:LAGLIDADG endonuclease